MTSLKVFYASLIASVSASAFLLLGEKAPSAALYFSAQFAFSLYLRGLLWPEKYLLHTEKTTLANTIRDFVIVYGSLIPNAKTKKEEEDILVEISESKAKFLIITAISFALPIIYFLATKRHSSLPLLGSYFIYIAISVVTLFSTHISQLLLPLIVSCITAAVTLCNDNANLEFIYFIYIFALFLTLESFTITLKKSKRLTSYNSMNSIIRALKQAAVLAIIVLLVNKILPDKNIGKTQAKKSQMIENMSNSLAKGLMKLSKDPKDFIARSILNAGSKTKSSRLDGIDKKELKKKKETLSGQLSSTDKLSTVNESLQNSGNSDPTLFVQTVNNPQLSDGEIQQRTPKQLVKEIKSLAEEKQNNESKEPQEHEELVELISANDELNAYHTQLYQDSQRKKSEDQAILKKLSNNPKAIKAIKAAQKKDKVIAKKMLKKKKRDTVKKQIKFLNLLQAKQKNRNQKTKNKELQAIQRELLKRNEPLSARQLKAIAKAEYKRAVKRRRSRRKNKFNDQRSDSSGSQSKVSLMTDQESHTRGNKQARGRKYFGGANNSGGSNNGGWAGRGNGQGNGGPSNITYFGRGADGPPNKNVKNKIKKPKPPISKVAQKEKVEKEKEEKKEKKLAKNIQKTFTTSIKLTQILMNILGILLLGLFIKRILQKINPNEKAKVSLTKQQILALIADFNRLNSMGSRPKEEVLRSYYTFLRLMDLVERPRHSSLPATNFSKDVSKEFSPISDDVTDLTAEFCNIYYGHKPVGDEMLNTVRTSRRKILKYFIS